MHENGWIRIEGEVTNTFSGHLFQHQLLFENSGTFKHREGSAAEFFSYSCQLLILSWDRVEIRLKNVEIFNKNAQKLQNQKRAL